MAKSHNAQMQKLGNHTGLISRTYIFFRFLLMSCLVIRTVKLHTTKAFDPEILSLLAAPARDNLRELHLTVSRVADGGHDELLELVQQPGSMQCSPLEKHGVVVVQGVPTEFSSGN